MDLDFVNRLAERYASIRSEIDARARAVGRLPEEIKIVAVSKTHPAEAVAAGMKAGIPIFGENYAQEFRDKNRELAAITDELPCWHFIGHLQSNKVKYVAPYVDAIHTIDSISIAEEIDSQAARHNRTIDVLLQINTSGEAAKSGCEPSEAVELAKIVSKFENLKLVGFMTIGSFSDDEAVIRKEFRTLKSARDRAREELGLELKELSMGMSHDYLIAVEEGATLVRIGTAIFGERDYSI
jgi:PLP dependent protein